MPRRRSRSRSPDHGRESRSPILRRRSEHDRGTGRDHEQERERNRRQSKFESPVQRTHERPGDINNRDRRREGERGEAPNHAWQSDVHPSRLMDIDLETGSANEATYNRADRFATERSGPTQEIRATEVGMRQSRGGRWRRENEAEVRRERGEGWGGNVSGRRSERDMGGGWRARDEGGRRGERGGSHRQLTNRRRTFEGEESQREVEKGHGEEVETRQPSEGQRGRGGAWRESRERGERDQVEREDRVFRERRLMDSLTDPRDVPKGSWYFEHDDRDSAQSSNQPSRRLSTGDERYRRDRRPSRDWERERPRERQRERQRGSDRRRSTGERERERGFRQRSPQVWRHDMFEKLQREEAGEAGENWGQEMGDEAEQDMNNGRQQRRSEVHRLGSRHEDSRRDQRSPRGSGIDGIWAHDKFTEHDKLVSYPIHHQQESELTVRGEKEREGERRQEAREALGGEGKEAREIVSEKMADEPPVIDKETAEVSMDTI